MKKTIVFFIMLFIFNINAYGLDDSYYTVTYVENELGFYIENDFYENNNNMNKYIDGKMYISLSSFSIGMNYLLEDIIWNGEKKEISMLKSDKTTLFKIGDNYVKINGVERYIESQPKIIDGKIYIPIKDFIELLACEYYEEDNGKKIYMRFLKEDVNRDNRIDMSDLEYLKGMYGMQIENSSINNYNDMDGNNYIDIYDMIKISKNIID